MFELEETPKALTHDNIVGGVPEEVWVKLEQNTTVKGKNHAPFMAAFRRLHDLAIENGYTKERFLRLLRSVEGMPYKASPSIIAFLYERNPKSANEALDGIVSGLVEGKFYIRVVNLFRALGYYDFGEESEAESAYKAHRNKTYGKAWFERLYQGVFRESPEEAKWFADEVLAAANQKGCRIIDGWNFIDGIKWSRRAESVVDTMVRMVGQD